MMEENPLKVCRNIETKSYQALFLHPMTMNCKGYKNETGMWGTYLSSCKK